MSERFTVLVMAAGRGTRMRSSLPKVLHPICGKPMVQWVIDAAREAGAPEVVCVTRPGDGVAAGLPDDVTVAEQREGEGTGAAVLAARGAVSDAGTVVVLSGDHPLVSPELIGALVATHGGARAAATILTTTELDPTGYGRVVRAPDGSVERIVETKYTEGLSADALALREINLGTYAFEAAELWLALADVEEDHGERYLTGVFPLLRERGA
jgi:bifunctional UDP-N-acetylglucosamine pyrophosphorylase/glucosamine-1-phosphate N-acetyltransferase